MGFFRFLICRVLFFAECPKKYSAKKPLLIKCLPSVESGSATLPPCAPAFVSASAHALTARPAQARQRARSRVAYLHHPLVVVGHTILARLRRPCAGPTSSSQLSHTQRPGFDAVPLWLQHHLHLGVLAPAPSTSWCPILCLRPLHQLSLPNRAVSPSDNILCLHCVFFIKYTSFRELTDFKP